MNTTHLPGPLRAVAENPLLVCKPKAASPVRPRDGQLFAAYCAAAATVVGVELPHMFRRHRADNYGHPPRYIHRVTLARSLAHQLACQTIPTYHQTRASRVFQATRSFSSHVSKTIARHTRTNPGWWHTQVSRTVTAATAILTETFNWETPTTA